MERSAKRRPRHSAPPSVRPVQIQPEITNFFSAAPVQKQTEITNFFGPNASLPTSSSSAQDTAPTIVVRAEPAVRKRKRSRAESDRAPKRVHYDVRRKLRCLAYSDKHGPREAARIYKVGSHGSVCKWDDKRKALEKLAKKKGTAKSLHPGKQSRYHELEGELRAWIVKRRARRICVTKRMVIAKAYKMSTEIAQLKGDRLANWWSGFRRRRRLTMKKVSSYRRVDDELLAPLLKHYRSVCVHFRPACSHFRRARIKFRCVRVYFAGPTSTVALEIADISGSEAAMRLACLSSQLQRPPLKRRG